MFKRKPATNQKSLALPEVLVKSSKELGYEGSDGEEFDSSTNSDSPKSEEISPKKTLILSPSSSYKSFGSPTRSQQGRESIGSPRSSQGIESIASPGSPRKNSLELPFANDEKKGLYFGQQILEKVKKGVPAKKAAEELELAQQSKKAAEELELAQRLAAILSLKGQKINRPTT